MQHNIVVELLGGTYQLSQPLTLTSDDSGSNGHQVIWRAAPGARPVLSGGKSITGWRLDDPSKNIWSAPAPPGLQTRQLFVNGQRAVRARSNGSVGDFTETSTGYQVTNTSIGNWPDASNLEAVADWQWKMYRCGVASVQQTSATSVNLTMDQPCWDNAHLATVAAYGMSTPTWIENAYELLDQPGEWYLDTNASRIYYIPRAGQTMSDANVIAPALQSLINVDGSRSDPVQDVSFKGLQFSYATWLSPSSGNGYADDQAGFHVDGSGHPKSQTDGHTNDDAETPAAVNVSYGRHIVVTSSVFDHLGGAGLNLQTGTQQSVVEGSRFTDLSSTGIQVGGVLTIDHHPSYQQDVTKDNVVQNNVVTYAGQEYSDAIGIFVGYTDHTVVAHNDLSELPYTGINVGWGWGMVDPGGNTRIAPIWGSGNAGWPIYNTPTTTEHNIVSDNRITDYMQVLHDGGAIYTLGWQGQSLADGAVLDGNVALDNSGNTNFTYYTDNTSRYLTIEDNVALANSSADWGGCYTYGDIVFQDNYWANPNTAWPCVPSQDMVTNVSFINNQKITSLQDVPSSILDNAGATSQPPKPVE